MSKHVVLLVQARMSSSRLPNKMMLCMHGTPIIGWIHHRLKKLKAVNQIIFAIPSSRSDDILSEYLKGQSAIVFRGSEDDVLDRFYNAAIFANADTIVRVCADNPFVCADEIDNLVNFFATNNCHYAYNHIPKENLYPNGFGAEITSFDTLSYLYQNAVLQEHREHIFNFILNNSHNFIIKTFNPDNPILNHPELRFDIDNIEDYRNLLKLNLTPDCTSIEIINSALKTQGNI